jgi:Sec-independent protein translocase protein TatA
MLFFGKDKLPDLAKGLGGSIKEFRNAINMGENKAEAKVQPKAETLEVAETSK